MNVGIDFDGTMMRSSRIQEWECDMWGNIIRSFLTGGYAVRVVTMRTADMEPGLVEGFLSNAGVEIPIIYCGQTMKHKACLDAGVHIDIWIDDMPELIR